MTSLHQWYLTHAVGGMFILHGVVTGHPKLPDAHSIHTSYLHSVMQDEEVPCRFVFRTKNTEYHLTMEDCDYKRCRRFIQMLPVPGELPGLEQWASQFEAFAQEYEKDEPACEAPDDAILLRLGNNREYYFDSMDIKLNGAHLPTRMWPHVGMFQDSVLCQSCRTDIDEEYDLRYFPYRNGNVEFYCWESQELPVCIENCGDDDLRVKVAQWAYFIPVGERVLIDPTNASPGVKLTSHQDLYDVWEQRNYPIKLSVDSDGKLTDHDKS